MMRRVALTGGIATGKSRVLAWFAARAVPTISADAIARDVVRPGEPAWTALRDRFGPNVFTTNGLVDRHQLAALVFDDSRARMCLESIVHPRVRALIEEWFADLEKRNTSSFAVADIPLLFETGREADFDEIIVTACEPETQLRRILTRDQLTEADARKRLAAQLPTADKIARARFVVRTDGLPADTDSQIKEIYTALSKQN